VLAVAAAALGYTAIVGAAVRQMLLERPLSDPDALNFALALLGVVAIAGAYGAALATIARRPRAKERELAAHGLK
jgi:Na+/proline symporter